MYYSIQHITRFRYDEPVSESIMEVMKQPRNETFQRCMAFQLTTTPQARVHHYQDYLGNTIHYFSVPRSHRRLQIVAEGLVEMRPPQPVPPALDFSVWEQIDTLQHDFDYWDWLMPTPQTTPTALLHDLIGEIGAARFADPLTVLTQVNKGMYAAFDYVPQSTTVDSPIDDALKDRRGVCQDFAHVMIAIVRYLGIPCRYVSGYLFHQKKGAERSTPDATHAWLEAWLPGIGWVGYDPTNNVLASERHIRVGVGRDYTDVPPTRGVFKGTAESELSVDVQIKVADVAPIIEDYPQVEEWVAEGDARDRAEQQQ